MAAVQELEDKLKGHAIHVGHGQDGDDIVTCLDGLAQYMFGKVIVRPQGTVGNHDTLREAGCAAGIVNHGHFFAILLMIIVHVLFAEVLREFPSVELVQMFAGISQLIGSAHHERVVAIVDDSFQMRHLQGIDNRSHMVANKEQTGVRVIHNVMNLFGHKLMQDGHGNSTIGQCGQEGCGPLARVAPAEGNLVALLYARVLKQDVQLLNFACNIVILQRLSFIVGQCVAIPVADNAFFD